MRFFDEMHSADQAVRDHYQVYERWLARQAGAQMRARREEAEMIFRRVGIPSRCMATRTRMVRAPNASFPST